MTKTTIKNRHGLKIVTLLEKAESPQGLAIVLHGLGGFKEQDHIETFAQAFKDANYTVLRYDSTRAFGESEGKYEDATTTSYYEDLEEVVNLAKEQDWYIEPLILAGHSLGAMVSVLYAQKKPQEVKAIAPISVVISRKLLLEAFDNPEYQKKWKKQGYIEEPSISRPGELKKLNWSFMEDSMKYNMMPEVEKLTMPALLIVGEKDSSTPPKHQKILFDKLPGKKELHIIRDAPHTFREKEHLDEIKQIFKNWLEKI